MTVLDDWQSQFAKWLLTGDTQLLNSQVIADKPERLGLYRNNVLANITQSLQSIFPVLERLIGTSCFTSLCHRFIQQHPPQKAALNHYGGQLADFISCQAAFNGHPYLPDVAQLEWATHVAFLLAEVKPVDTHTLASLEQKELLDIHLSLASSVQLVMSKFPILAIWQANHSTVVDPPTVHLMEKEEHLIVFREGEQFVIEPVTSTEWFFLQAINHTVSLNQAYEHALTHSADFDLAGCLQKYVSSGVISDVLPVIADKNWSKANVE
ncbi:HvfC/BufC family peptide modification chaperone [Zooshikella harenae]|uniref:DNA-binding domain-containing protein n=1 Tax=Zooshikella harenae TaxID=2827238 RepID=A0ABS5ZAX7_9GAMM|nr:putative DNA-binding domain-containing protein [Zooshikella harenae]MBU2711149.1 putative DNA-binding domain-containing protein [Zooshikella harenae]